MWNIAHIKKKEEKKRHPWNQRNTKLLIQEIFLLGPIMLNFYMEQHKKGSAFNTQSS